jgi:hypothetical protein
MFLVIFIVCEKLLLPRAASRRLSLLSQRFELLALLEARWAHTLREVAILYRGSSEERSYLFE